MSRIDKGIQTDSHTTYPAMYLTGMKSNMEPVPVIPPSITGPCVYGHITTDEHRDNFRRAHPDVEDWQSSDPLGLVSVASLYCGEYDYCADVVEVDDEGERRTCVIYVDYKGHNGLYDRRWSPSFVSDLEKLLGITGKPQWYPRYSRSSSA